ncbi:bifunctional adenosylcobinamide kinase/adenosylcobinamide-phosphate guanylyltransferase [Colwellia sp. 12G3]|uniref:bifunctional adenosylcobinamide kinase/adenosylcobinamide-phosphate guanylyltransferase n=1 Tax=Colwellia sp. 12G3 TaxID=2058299 RepID=UPI000C32418D|nr:bifunctional adenosylcobinamide kinase/adenosylcobinamide-phosphate guanylyltransferase [Colwellia sp. 12G3]PKI17024.1 bifunctional adenosylcobinamide kinase/adenosylcobinamide-phosphate guanylyltransferase [Colwellia sp. 12G3]
MIHFVLGGARSGKSRFAEQQISALAEKQGKQAVYIATATAIDTEMGSRISQHQRDRGDGWQLIECPLALAETLTDLDNNNVYLLDCLTLWLNNQLYNVHEASSTEQGQHLQSKIDILTAQLTAIDVDIVIVSNEIGLGVVPMGESTRLYVDYCGWLNQKIAEISDKVTLVTAGIPLCIKSIIE